MQEQIAIYNDTRDFSYRRFVFENESKMVDVHICGTTVFPNITIYMPTPREAYRPVVSVTFVIFVALGQVQEVVVRWSSDHRPFDRTRLWEQDDASSEDEVFRARDLVGTFASLVRNRKTYSKANVRFS